MDRDREGELKGKEAVEVSCCLSNKFVNSK